MLGGKNESEGILKQATVACSKVTVQNLPRKSDISRITSSGQSLYGHNWTRG
jgi:hypothetical protein